jgi:hypothetical protein
LIKEKAMDRRKVIAGVVAVLLVAIAAWAFGLIGTTDPAVAELQTLREQMSNETLSEAQRDALRDNFRDRMRALSDEQRRAFFDANRDQWRGRMDQRMNEFFALSPVDQKRRLDEMIDRMRQPRPSRPQSDARGGRGDGQRRGNWANMSEAQRDERAKRRLDRSSATQRAQRTEFRRRLVERAKQRGISDLPSEGARRGWRGASDLHPLEAKI